MNVRSISYQLNNFRRIFNLSEASFTHLWNVENNVQANRAVVTNTIFSNVSAQSFKTVVIYKLQPDTKREYLFSVGEYTLKASPGQVIFSALKKKGGWQDDLS